MSDPVTRLNAALEGRYAIERELGEGGMVPMYRADGLPLVWLQTVRLLLDRAMQSFHL